jgi:D-glucuronyl C5-epimerase-like protein
VKSPQKITLAAVAAVLVLGAPAPARASDVYVVNGDRTALRDDPALPAAPDPAACGAPSAPQAAAAAASGPTVVGTLRKLGVADRYEPVYRHARVVRDRLKGLRKRELSAVIGDVQSLVARRLLTVSRVPVVFLQLQRNTEYWPSRPVPKAPVPKVVPCAGKAGLGGARVMFGDDPVVFQWYPGQGLQIQELATFGRANAFANACRPEAGPQSIPCDHDKLRAALEGIRRLAVTRAGFTAWEYYFGFGGGKPPWISGLAQGTAMQALARGSQILGDPAYLDLARGALGAFERAAPTGVRVRAAAGPTFLLYSFSRGLRVFNAFFQALNGIYDYAQAANDDHATAVFTEAEREARREAPLADTGAWSRYSLGGAESDLGYHKLVRDFLTGLCARTSEAVYCDVAKRFNGYLRQRTRLRLVGASPLRARRTARVRVLVSKVSCVTVTVRRGGRVVATLVRVLARGQGVFFWTPPRAGAYAIGIDARDLAGHHTPASQAVTVRR